MIIDLQKYKGLIPIFDNGHGSTINGIYQTPGKRSPKWSKGILFEGVFNRWVVNRLIEKCQREGIPFYHLSPELTDKSLKTRTNIANKIWKQNKNTYVLSIHANAGGGSGIEGYTTTGETKSDVVAELFLSNLKKVGFKLRTDRTDNDLDKEKNFWMLRVPASPAVLLELGFMDNWNDYQDLWDVEYLELVVEVIFKTIKQLYYGEL